MAKALIPGTAAGPVVATQEGLSFWGGVDGATGRIIDAHYPLHGRSITGLVTPRRGRITLHGQDVTNWPAHQSAQNGLALVPESRGMFHLLTVEENLRISVRKGAQWSLRDIYTIFPRPEERRRNGGGQLSRREQQMFAVPAGRTEPCRLRRTGRPPLYHRTGLHRA